MTNQTIPPCPVCGVVPKWADQQLHLGVVVPRCVCLTCAAIDSSTWQERCMYEMHNALLSSGITTIAQLNERLAPDPRVAVLEAAIAEHRRCTLCERDAGHGTPKTYKDIDDLLWSKIAAQRGEVEK